MDKLRIINRFCLAGALLGSNVALASYQVNSPGPLLNLGKTSHPSSILSIGNNPAAGEALLDKDESMRFGYFSNLGVQGEFGDVDNFMDEIDDLKDSLDRDDLDFAEALNLQARFNDILPVLGDDATLALSSTVYAPLMPAAIRSDWLGGILSFSIQGGGAVDVSFLDDPLSIAASGSSYTLETDSAVYFKSAELLTGSIGYSREVWRPEFMPTAQVHAGVQANVYRASMNKSVISIQSIIDDEDVGDAIRDERDENTRKTTQVGLDVGFLMTTPNTQLGLTFANINEPEFDYGDIGKNCTAITDPTRRNNCVIAQQVFADEIELSETAKMDAQMTVDGAWFTRDKQLLLAGYADMNSVYDLVGNESQNIGVSASYFSDSYLIPNVRLSINKNLAGSELTMYGFGTTLFGVFNLDFAMSSEMVEVDGNDVPRAFGFNIGFEEKF